MATYLAICLLMSPVYFAFSTGPAGIGHSIFTLGNLGFVEPKCYWQLFEQNLSRNEQAITCDIGSITEIKYIGIIPVKDTEKSVIKTKDDK